VTSYKRTIP